jgi:hypothetical protein
MKTFFGVSIVLYSILFPIFGLFSNCGKNYTPQKFDKVIGLYIQVMSLKGRLAVLW